VRGGVITGLERIVGVIEEFELGGTVGGARRDQTPAFRADRALAVSPEAARGFGRWGGGAIELRPQAAAVESGWRG
jgi:hypothetical protein